jgi:hypothetical protein
MIDINKNDYDIMVCFIRDFFKSLNLEIIKLSLFNHFKNDMNKEINLLNYNINDIVEVIIINNINIYYCYNKYYKIDFNNINNLYINI